MSKYFRLIELLETSIPQVGELESEFNNEVAHLGSLDDENFTVDTRIKRANIKDFSVEPRKMCLDYFYVEQTTDVTLSSSYQDLTGASITLSHQFDAKYLLFYGFITPAYTTTTGAWNGQILVDASAIEIIPVSSSGSADRRSSPFSFITSNQSAGSHTVKLQAKIAATTPTQTYAYIHLLVTSQ